MKTNIPWAAGLFEGEGCIHQRTDGYYMLQLRMTDYDVVQAFRDVFGVGNIVTEEHADRKDAYRWTMGKRSEVRRILDLMLPYFGNRRAHKALDCLDDLENI